MLLPFKWKSSKPTFFKGSCPISSDSTSRHLGGHSTFLVETSHKNRFLCLPEGKTHIKKCLIITNKNLIVQFNIDYSKNFIVNFYKYLKILIIKFDQKNLHFPFVSEHSSAFSPLRIKNLFSCERG